MIEQFYSTRTFPLVSKIRLGSLTLRVTIAYLNWTSERIPRSLLERSGNPAVGAAGLASESDILERFLTVEDSLQLVGASGDPASAGLQGASIKKAASLRRSDGSTA